MLDLSETALVGPNAVTRTLEVVRESLGEGAAERLAEAAGRPDWFTDPPGEMVSEAEVAALHGALRRIWPEEAPALAAEAGRRTGAYILAHRIPRPAQAVLRLLPPRLAAGSLSKAIARHAWTFAGSGRFAAPGGRPWRVEIAANPFVAGERSEAPLCHWHAAVFETLFRALVHPRARARETCCAAMGAPACVFVIDWR